MSDCIQLVANFVSLHFRIFSGWLCKDGVARNLPDWSANGQKVVKKQRLLVDRPLGQCQRADPKVCDFYCVQFF
jgi:hypothetical protein